MIIGTAGHIDHGKTALVRALTGVDTDRLPEEKKRGITIELGFAPLTLDGVGVAGVVDVPGHEAFVRTMVAGATGIDLALLVVAADEGVMPQTREHLAILELLGVNTGVIALTKADLVDDDWLALVEDDVRQAAARALPSARIVPTSVRDGPRHRRASIRARVARDVGPRARPRRPLPTTYRSGVHHQGNGNGRHWNGLVGHRAAATTSSASCRRRSPHACAAYRATGASARRRSPEAERRSRSPASRRRRCRGARRSSRISSGARRCSPAPTSRCCRATRLRRGRGAGCASTSARLRSARASSPATPSPARRSPRGSRSTRRWFCAAAIVSCSARVHRSTRSAAASSSTRTRRDEGDRGPSASIASSGSDACSTSPSATA